MQILTGRRTGASHLAFSPDSRYLAAGGTGGAHVWDLTASGVRAVPYPESLPHTLAFLAGNRLLLQHDSVFNRRTGWVGEYRLYDPASPEPAATFALRIMGYSQVFASPARVRLCGVSGPNSLRAWDATTLPTVVELWTRRTSESFNHWQTAVAISDDRVAVGEHRHYQNDREAIVTVRAAVSGEVTDRIACRYADVTRMAFSPDGAQLAAQSGAALTVWGMNHPPAKPRKVNNPSRKHFLDFAFHPSGRILATVDSGRLIRFWDTDTWTETRTFGWNIGKLRAVAFSPDGTRAATGSHTGRVLLWDVDV